MVIFYDLKKESKPGSTKELYKIKLCTIKWYSTLLCKIERTPILPPRANLKKPHLLTSYLNKMVSNVIIKIDK